MLHRSTLLAFLSTALLLPAAATHAAAAPPVVAGPTAQGATLTATLQKGLLCPVVHLPAGAPETDQDFAEHSSRCDDVPVLGPLDFSDGLAGVKSGDTVYDAGATGGDVAAVELRQDGRVLAHVATQPSTLPGTTDLRFYLIQSGGAPNEIAYLDASGAVRRAADFDSTGSDDDPGQVPSTRPQTLAHGKGYREGTWSLSAYGISPIVSTPLQPERRLIHTCVTLTARGGSEGDDTSTCAGPGPQIADMVITGLDADGCGAVGRYTGAVVGSAVAAAGWSRAGAAPAPSLHCRGRPIVVAAH